MSKEIQFRRSTAVLTLLAASLGGGLIAAFTVMSRGDKPPATVSAYAPQTSKETPASSKAAMQGSYADVLEKVTPAVVNIASTRVIKASEQKQQGNPMMQDPFFRKFFGDGQGDEDGQQGPGMGRRRQPRDQKDRAGGSGVIINSAGYILTNNHVVEKASDVKVTLLDKREFTAKVLGTDPQTDIAVLKIEAKDLPSLNIGDSDKARIGDLCFAVGNPFGIGQTVTMGIVSAKGRSVAGAANSSLSLQDFLQTDASINPGNSGGALVNAHGELIGINTMILAGGGGMGGMAGNIGIGFAVPSGMAKQVSDQIIKTGKVSRGYMGVTLQGLDRDLAQQFGLPDDKGALVSTVTPNSPGAKGGLKEGDIITGIDGQKIEDRNELTLKVIQHTPGSRVSLDVIRDRKPMKVSLTLEERPTGLEVAKNGAGKDKAGPDGDQGVGPDTVGLEVESLTPEITRQLEMPMGTKGAIITAVEDGSPAQEAALNRGDVVIEANRQPVNSAQDLGRVIRESKTAGKKVLLKVLQTAGGQTQTGFRVLDPK